MLDDIDVGDIAGGGIDDSSPVRDSLQQQRIVSSATSGGGLGPLGLPAGSGAAALPGLRSRRPSIAVAATNSKASRSKYKQSVPLCDL